MAAGVYNITIEQGASFAFQFVVQNIDLTGYTAKGIIKKLASDTAILGTFTCTVISTFGTIVAPINGISTTVQGGIVSVTMTPQQTAALLTTGGTWQDTTNLVYDIEVATAYTGSELRVLNGYCFVSPEVTP